MDMGKIIAMAKSSLTDSEKVNVHIQQPDPAVAGIVDTLKAIILAADKTIAEQIKGTPLLFITAGR